MSRAELLEQLSRYAGGSASANQLSSWAAEARDRNDAAEQRIGVGEHWFINHVLDQLVFASEPGFQILPAVARDLIAKVESEPYPSRGLLDR